MNLRSPLLGVISLVWTLSYTLPLTSQTNTRDLQTNNRDLIVLDIEVVGHDIIPGISALSVHKVLENVAPERSPGSHLKDILQMHADLFGSSARKDSLESIAIGPWMQRDGVGKEEIDSWVPASETAPFRLLAIVNRPDLHQREAVGKASSFGQVRFVYCLVKSTFEGSIRDRPCTSFLMSVEVDILSDGNSEEVVRRFLLAWTDLRSLDPTMLTSLDRFAVIMEALGELSAVSVAVNINEIETDLALGKSPALDATWVMRSFILDPLTGDPRPIAIASYRDRTWIAKICGILEELQPVLVSEMPALVRDAQSNATRSDLTATMSLSDSRSEISSIVRETCPKLDPSWFEPLTQSLAEGTCNGCHGTVTDTLFTHISPRDVGREARLSRFLLGSRLECEAITDCRAPFDRRRGELIEFLRFLDEATGNAD